MKKIFSITLLVFAWMAMHTTVFAQKTDQYPRLTNLSVKQNLAISKLKVDVNVVGKMASTTFDFYFIPPKNSRERKGEFTFPLADGQRVTHFAYQLAKELRQGVVVEKTKAKKTFEAIVRKNIDPALLEKVSGNAYRTQIFPMQPNKPIRIVITYEEQLNASGKELRYRLPLYFGQKVNELELNVEVFKKKADFTPQHSIQDIRFEQWSENYRASYKKQNFEAKKLLSFSIPLEERKEEIYIEKSDELGTAFYVQFTPKQKRRAKKLPEHITVAWDVSFSMRNRNINKEVELLEAYFQKVKSAKVLFIPFAHEKISSKAYTIKDGNWTALREAILEQEYEGTNDYTQLNLHKIKTDEVLLFTDGLSPIGKYDFELGKAPIVCVNSQIKANYPFLRYVTSSTGGSLINLQKAGQKQALRQLVQPNFQFIRAEYNAQEVEKTYPSVSAPVTTDFAFAGVLKSGRATVKLHFGFGNEVTYTQTVVLKQNKIGNSKGMVERFWATSKLQELEMRSKENKAEIIATAKKFGIVTDYTSLIVLDRMQDYLQYEIVPPKHMQEEYFKKIASKKERIKKDELTALDQAAIAYKERIKWWEKEYNFDWKKWKLEQEKKKQDKLVRDSALVIRGTSNAFTGSVAGVAVVTEADEVNEDIEIVEVEAEEEVAENEVAFLRTDDRRRNRKSRRGKRPKASIQLKAWDPQMPYIDSLREAKTNHFELYKSLRKQHMDVPSFYADVAEFFYQRGDKELALSILLNIAELGIDSHKVLRMLARKLLQWNKSEYAVFLFEKVLTMRPYEAHSYRDLGLAYERNKEYQKAVDTLYQVARRKWERNIKIVPTVIMEMNAIATRHKISLNNVDQRLRKNLPVDLRIVLNWGTDNSDMDLWVIDPIKEKCFYSHKNTRIGGYFPYDFTTGYGPEEFLLRKAISGKYMAKANYYGTREQGAVGPTTIQLELITYFGTPQQERKEITLRLSSKRQIIDIGELIFEALSDGK